MFLTQLNLKPIDRGRTWRLTAPLAFRSKRIGLVIVPAGFVCDLNSIPRPLWFLAPPTFWPEAGALHDWLYRVHPSRSEADAVYREALEALGVGRLRRNVRYWAVKVFGRRAYKNGQKEGFSV